MNKMKPSSISVFHPSLSITCFFIPIVWYLNFIFLVLHLFPFPESLFCLARDSIAPNQGVPDGETIVSAGEVYELGFFSPSGSNNARYVGIWLKQFPHEKVVWVANRENPVRDSSGALMIGANGNLAIADGATNTIWSSNVTLASNHTVAVLSDMGNLVLKENKSNGQVLWESFNNPTDSFMPGMKMGLNTRTGEQITLTSWKGDADPSLGDFVTAVDPQESPQLIVKNGAAKYWRSGQWTGRMFVGIPNMNKDYRTGFNFNQDNEEGTIYFSFEPFSNVNGTGLIYLIYTGDTIVLDWDEGSQLRKKKIVPRGPCDLYNTCGSFGTCNNNELPICKCLEGHEPKSMAEWSKGNWTSGCVRRTKFRCERNTSSDKADGFVLLTGMKLPDFSHNVIADDIEDCKSICLNNCSCLACSFVDGIGCMLWGEDLIDLQEFPFGGQELHIRLAYSELRGNSSTRARTIIIVTIVCSVILVLSFVMYILCRWRNRGIGGRTSRDDEQRHILKDVIAPGGSSELPSFSLESIKAATDNFSATNKLGQGGFGPVYKGRLSDGREIAVKKLSKSSGQGTEEFKNEVLLISKLQHRSLVKILGFCIKGEERMLVYEYMPNKSLDKLIFGSTENVVLNWSLRSKIIEGVARGLLYLHHDSRLKIIHRDLKVSNILLDEHMNPKISDFGMARIFEGDQSTANTNRVVGTYGYMSPEYAMQGIFSEKSDVFSFGVLLLEVISGKRNNELYHSENPQNLLGHASQLWNEGKPLELLDPRLDNLYNPTQVNRCIHVALLCVQEHATDRPTMSMVVSMLCNETSLPSPNRPAFSSNERVDESYPSLPKSFTCSTNDISITSLHGR